MSTDQLDAETAETVAGAVRLLHQAAALAWAATDADGPGSAGQLFALSLDEAADQARALLPPTADLAGPVPVGSDPAGLLRSADQLLCRLTRPAGATSIRQLQARVADLVWEANTGVGG